jgi:hypothetical protein
LTSYSYIYKLGETRVLQKEKNKLQNKWDKDRGSITSGGASSQGEKRNIPFVIVVKGGEIKSKKNSSQRNQNIEYISQGK